MHECPLIKPGKRTFRTGTAWDTMLKYGDTMSPKYILLATALLLTVNFSEAGTLSTVGRDQWVRVERIFDGDTFRAKSGERVRLLGINAPEVIHETKPGQVFGKRSGAMLRRLIQGRIVRLKTDREIRDIYGRLLAQVYLRDGTWINREMIRRGMAHVYTFTPNIRWASALATAEKQARKKKIGIWGTERFRILAAEEAGLAHVGQFRLVRGIVHGRSGKGYSFLLGNLSIHIPRTYRYYFRHVPKVRNGMRVIVHGTFRMRNGALFLALHSSTDLEILR